MGNCLIEAKLHQSQNDTVADDAAQGYHSGASHKPEGRKERQSSDSYSQARRNSCANSSNEPNGHTVTELKRGQAHGHGSHTRRGSPWLPHVNRAHDKSTAAVPHAAIGLYPPIRRTICLRTREPLHQHRSAAPKVRLLTEPKMPECAYMGASMLPPIECVQLAVRDAAIHANMRGHRSVQASRPFRFHLTGQPLASAAQLWSRGQPRRKRLNPIEHLGLS